MLQAFAADMGLAGVPVAQLSPAAAAHIGATPTLLYLSRQKFPTRVWVGLMSNRSQEEARIALNALLAARGAR